MANLQLADNLRRLRKEYHYTQAQLGKKLHITHQAYSNYETGARDPNIYLLAELSNLYNVPITLLLTQSCNATSKFMKDAKRYSWIRIENSENKLLLNDKEVAFFLRYRSASDQDRERIHKILSIEV